MRPEAAAARHLHELLGDRDLDMFVLFSSFAATVGAPGRGVYRPPHYYGWDRRDLPRLDVPTLLLRATSPEQVEPGGPTSGEIPTSSQEHSSQVTAAEVAGDHFSLMGDDVRTTAQAVREWLTRA